MTIDIIETDEGWRIGRRWFATIGQAMRAARRQAQRVHADAIELHPLTPVGAELAEVRA